MVSDGEIAGTVGQGKRIEQYKIVSSTSGVMYRSYISGTGWQEYVNSSEASGESGHQIEMIQVRLTSELAEVYNIYYRVHVSNIGWLDWACNNQITGTSYHYQIEAIQVKLVRKGNSAPGKTSDIFRGTESIINYSTDIYGQGWSDLVSDGEVAGTVGQGKRIEQYKIISSSNLNGIMYRSYISGTGWQEYMNSSEVSGKSGHQIEIIQIKLTSELAAEYNIYYRVHVSNIGWLDWACNDQITGTSYHYQIEAIQVKLVKKGNSAPGKTSDIFRGNKSGVSYSTNIYGQGWSNLVSDGEIAGTVGQGKRIEQYKIVSSSIVFSGSVMYRSYVSGTGWQEYVNSTEVSGESGHQIEMIQVKLTSELAAEYDVYYRVHVSNVGWLDWACNDQITGTSYHYQIEAIQVKLVRKGNSAPGKTVDTFKGKMVDIGYSSNVYGQGWSDLVSDGEISGTVGKGKRIEQYKIISSSIVFSGNVMYRSYVSGTGWQEYVNSTEVSGESGHQIEMIQVKLTSELAAEYDIYYRVHVSNIGWLDWACNDQITGTNNYHYQIEAIQVKLVKKGNNAPGKTSDIFRDNKFYVEYLSYIYGDGWLDNTFEFQTSGNVESSVGIGAIKVNLYNKLGVSGSIQYSTHVGNIGWLDYVNAGDVSGVVDQLGRVEAIKIRLVGDVSRYYDIYYKTYIEDYGWLDWAKNDAIAGSVGFSKKVMAIKIGLVEKGGAAPGSTKYSQLTAAFVVIDGKTYYYENGKKVTGFKVIDGIKYFFNSSGVLISRNVKKILDVSVYQGDIDWNKVKKTDVDGAILRLGYGTSYTTDACVMDKKFERNYNGARNLGLLFGIYLYSYAIDNTSAAIEANFVLEKLRYYNVSKNIPIYYDLEENPWTTNLSKDSYHNIVSTFSSILENAGYSVKVYSYKYWAENRLDSYVNNKLDWIAQYSDYCTYIGGYRGWQYTASGRVDGISGDVDISVWIN